MLLIADISVEVPDAVIEASPAAESAVVTHEEQARDFVEYGKRGTAFGV